MKILAITAIFLFRILVKFRLWPLGVYAVLMNTVLRDFEQTNPMLAMIGFYAVGVMIAASWIFTIIIKVRGGVQK